MFKLINLQCQVKKTEWNIIQNFDGYCNFLFKFILELQTCINVDVFFRKHYSLVLRVDVSLLWPIKLST
jgi:hypothetical protein